MPPVNIKQIYFYKGCEPSLAWQSDKSDRETLFDFNQWWITFRGYCRQFKYVGCFFDPEARFCPEKANYGFVAVAAGLRRSLI